MAAVRRIYTIGHSTRRAEEFVAMLQAHAVTAVADVRAIPRSRRHPHFSGPALQSSLAAHGIAYEHLPGLGGLRTPDPASRNTGWREPAFRAYADHMATPEFADALAALLQTAQKFLAAVMCAESQWWHCHRQLIADALLVRGIEVCHIVSAAEAAPHQLTPFAQVVGAEVRYPGLL